MSVIALGATTLPGVSYRDFWLHFGGRPTSQTTLIADTVTPEIAAVLDTWEGKSHAVPTELPVRTYPQDPVAAVAYLVDVLKLSQDTILRAVGVPERTFFGWKTAGHKPRIESLGRLWPTVEVIHQMTGAHPNLAAWFASNAAAQARFTSGDLNGLVELEFNDAFRRANPRPAFIPFDEAFVEPPSDEAAPARRRLARTSTPPRGQVFPARRTNPRHNDDE